jgi:glucose/arabinose dehydrogenase
MTPELTEWDLVSSGDTRSADGANTVKFGENYRWPHADCGGGVCINELG